MVVVVAALVLEIHQRRLAVAVAKMLRAGLAALKVIPAERAASVMRGAAAAALLEPEQPVWRRQPEEQAAQALRHPYLAQP